LLNLEYMNRPCARKMDTAEQMPEIMNKLIADAAEADAKCERLRGDNAQLMQALVVKLTERDEANIAAERYRLARDFLLTLFPDEIGNPLQTVAYANFMRNEVERAHET
jgi:hypothetical protein